MVLVWGGPFFICEKHKRSEYITVVMLLVYMYGGVISSMLYGGCLMAVAISLLFHYICYTTWSITVVVNHTCLLLYMHIYIFLFLFSGACLSYAFLYTGVALHYKTVDVVVVVVVVNVTPPKLTQARNIIMVTI